MREAGGGFRGQHEANDPVEFVVFDEDTRAPISGATVWIAKEYE